MPFRPWSQVLPTWGTLYFCLRRQDCLTSRTTGEQNIRSRTTGEQKIRFTYHESSFSNDPGMRQSSPRRFFFFFSGMIPSTEGVDCWNFAATVSICLYGL